MGVVGALGCVYLFFSLPTRTELWFLGWNAAGLLIYFLYARPRVSRLRQRTSTLRRVSNHHCRTMPVRLTPDAVAETAFRVKPGRAGGFSPLSANRSAQIHGVRS